MQAVLALLSVLILALAMWLWLTAVRRRRAAGLPAGEVIYVDTGAWRRNEKPLFSRRYRLVGKPDYLVKTRRETIPVEVKSTALRGDDPYDSHKLQLAAYCLLVEDVLGQRPSHGILKYSNAAIRLPFSNALRTELLAALEQMSAARTRPDISRSHDDVARCGHCGYRHACGAQALA